MEYIIGGILAIIVIITVGLLLRKKLYDAVDEYEDWKLDIMNRNVPEELSKVKELNLEGDTKEDFEKWRLTWEEILTNDLANVEELLFDTEKAADRYKFSAAKKSIQKMEEKLTAIEKKIEEMLAGLHELLETEAKNREEIESLQPRILAMKQHLSKNRFQYTHAEKRFEEALVQVEQTMNEYGTSIENGNYIHASTIVEEVKEQTEKLENEIEEFPILYKQCKQLLPIQLDELKSGLAEMKQQGYAVESLNVESEITEYQSRLTNLVKMLENEGTENVQSLVAEIESRITEIYDMLEQEAIARNYVETKVPSYERALDEFETKFLVTQKEVEELKQAYYFENTDLEQFEALDAMLTQLKEQLISFTESLSKNDAAHSTLKEELEDAFSELETIDMKHEAFKESIQNLRKDELEAHEQIQEMNEEIYKTNRKIRSSNLPGIPHYIWELMDEASHRNEQVLEALEQQPLDMMDVQQALGEAKAAVNNVLESTNMMLDQAYLTEHVIQYANRYRSSYPELAAKLAESENLFRKAEYELSLEEAAKALEAIEPGALKKVEKYQEQTVS